MVGSEGVVKIKPQPGFQHAVLSSPADVVVMGGSAGCGKTWCLLLEAVRNLKVKGFNALIFRRQSRQITTTGGLWDKSVELYNNLPAPYIPRIRSRPYSFRFPQGSTVELDHINQTLDVIQYQGAEICYIGFDELTHFERSQFIYMLSRNRSMCGVRPFLRASTNPQGSGWVKDMIQWYLYPDNYEIEELQGAPIPERRGVVRYFSIVDNEFRWGNTREECWNSLPESHRKKVKVENIKSFTFIGGLLHENKVLLDVDPGYEGNLMAQERNQQVQLLDGRWIDVDADARRLYEDADIYDLWTNSFNEPTGQAKNRYMTADVALEGADDFTVGIWDGWVLIRYYEFPVMKAEDVQPTLERIARENRIPQSNIAFDGTGVGAMIKGYLRHAFPVTGAMAPLKDKEETGEQKEGATRPNYRNVRAQLYWKLRQVLKDKTAYVAVNDIDLQRKLTQELKAIKKADLDPEKKLQIISNDDIKQDIKRSPDRAVMFAMRCVFELIPPPAKTTKRRIVKR